MGNIWADYDAIDLCEERYQPADWFGWRKDASGSGLVQPSGYSG